jgi:glycosyltransferase involved in cell wall biosynthesis
VLPAHSEAWGLVINEAMAVGLPVIVSKITGCVDDLVNHLETGFIIQNSCVNEIRLAIDFMIVSSRKRESMGLRAQQKIAEWTLENEARNLWQGWKKLLCI